MSLIEFSHVSVGYGRKVVLAGLDFSLPEGDYLALVGPNGAGKSTLLKTMVGSLKPLAGAVRTARKLRFGYVPQGGQLDPLYPLTVQDVVMMGRYPQLGLLRRPSRADWKRGLDCLDQVSIADLARRPFRALSGGQRQRVLMARALNTEPDVLILDEPTNGMDLASEQEAMRLIGQFHERGMTVVLVTHMLGLVANHASRIGILHQGLALGTAAEVLTSERLSKLFGREVEVGQVQGQTVVVTR